MRRTRDAPGEEEDEVGEAEQGEAGEEAGEGGSGRGRRSGEVGAECSHEEVILSGERRKREMRER